MEADEVAQLALEHLGLTSERSDPQHLLSRDPDSSGLWHRSQSPWERRREVLGPLAQHGPSDRSRIDLLDFLASRSLRRETPISFGATRITSSPVLTSAFSR
jgi:hypothetical protein